MVEQSLNDWEESSFFGQARSAIVRIEALIGRLGQQYVVSYPFSG